MFKNLTSEQYRVTQKKGTEQPYTGEFYDFFEEGQYLCICCKHHLFSSQHKYDSGSGWPSFSSAIKDENLKYNSDYDIGYERIEVTCGNCEAHLGHLFHDGPTKEGKRYCINSASLSFVRKR